MGFCFGVIPSLPSGNSPQIKSLGFLYYLCDFHTDWNRLSSCHKCAPARGTRGLHKKQSPPCTSLQLFFSTKDTLIMHMATRAAALPQRLLHVGVGSEATVVPDATLARFGLTRTWARRRRRAERYPAQDLRLPGTAHAFSAPPRARIRPSTVLAYARDSTHADTALHLAPFCFVCAVFL